MSKLNAKWLNFDAESLKNTSGALKLNIDTTADTLVETGTGEGVKVNNSVVAFLAGDQTITGIKTFDTLPKSAVTPTDADELVRKGFVDGLLTGLSWEHPIYHANQLVDGSTGVGGIRPCTFVDIDDYTGWSATDTITIDWNDGSAKQAILTAVDNASPGNDQFDIGTGAGRNENDQDLAIEIIRCVNDSTTALMVAIQGESERSVDTAYFVADDPEEWTQFEVTVDGPAVSAFKVSDTSITDTPNLGMAYTSLTGNQTHFARGNDNGYTWNDDGETWIQVTGVGSLPDATKDIYGVVRIGDGIAVTSGIISLDLTADAGLELTGAAGYQTIGINIASGGGLETTASGTSVAAAGIIDSMINWGVGATEVSAIDMPIADVAVLYDSTSVEAALAEAMTDINSNAGAISTNAGDISTNAGNISTNAGNISTNAGAITAIEDNTITGGDGITSGGDIGNDDQTIAIDLAPDSTAGLQFLTGELAIKLKTDGGLSVTNDGLEVDTSLVAFENKDVEVISLTSGDETAGYKDIANLPIDNTAVQVAVSGGIQQRYGVDFTIMEDASGDMKRVVWDSAYATTAGTAPSSGVAFEENDVLIIWYTY